MILTPVHALARLVHRRAALGDTGDASLQMVICFPAVLFLLLMVVEGCNVYLAKEAATTAAREGVASARGYGAGPDAGVQRATTVLARLDGTLNHGTASREGSTPDQVRITIRGQAPSLLGLTINITEQASGPVEKWTTP
ncbi:TadE/TadG family type IV pilus assembly protein [Kitasatospora sp. NPDC057904]|uniref:TadE/TadG family type IV pilus assembly protein n=1 Tax=unclassified Kitasatospora TaxID=2633591 RepID=UPI0036D99E02